MSAIIFVAQLLSSLLRSLSVNSVANGRTFKAVAVTALSDLFFYGVTSGVTAQVIAGNCQAIFAAVAGGALGNWLAMTMINHSNQSSKIHHP